MSANAPDHFVTQFATNIQLKLQQKGSRLRKTVMEGTHYGEKASPVDQIGAIEMQQVVSQFAPKSRTDAVLDRRWVFGEDYELNQMLDSYDKLKLLIDPKSKQVENAVLAAGRQIDRFIYAAAVGSAKTGKNGGTTTNFLSGNIINVNFGGGSDVGLTVEKLIEAKRLLMRADVDLESDELWCPIGATQHANLLSQIEVISSDFNGGMPVMKDGKLMEFLGIKFVHTEITNATANLSSGDAVIPVYAKSGMYLGIWDDIKTDIGVRRDISKNPWEASVTLTAGATRLEEAKVVKILCNI